MRRVMMILLAMFSTVAMSAVGASAAGAGTGTLAMGGPPCNITFDSTGGPGDPNPGTVTVDNVVEAAGCAFGVKNPDTYVDLTFDGSGNVQANGIIKISVFGVNCTYSLTSVPGTNTVTAAWISGSLSKTAGSFLCSNPALMTMQMDLLSDSTLSIGGPACDITFAATGGPTDPTPNSITVDNVNAAAGCAFGVKNPDTYVDLDFDGSGNIDANGMIKVSVFGLGCTYAVNTVPGSNTATTARISGLLPKMVGAFLCPPNPASSTLRLAGL